MTKSITPEDLHRLRQGGNTIDLIDVRTPGEYASVHAEGAVSVPLDRLSPEAVAAARTTSPEKPVYCICQSGRRSMAACGQLAARGLDVVNVAGGTSAWERAGLPVTRPAGAACGVAFSQKVRLLGLGAFVVAVVLGMTLHAAFLWAAVAIWAGLLIAGRGACPLCVLPSRSPAPPPREP